GNARSRRHAQGREPRRDPPHARIKGLLAQAPQPADEPCRWPCQWPSQWLCRWLRHGSHASHASHGSPLSPSRRLPVVPRACKLSIAGDPALVRGSLSFLSSLASSRSEGAGSLPAADGARSLRSLLEMKGLLSSALPANKGGAAPCSRAEIASFQAHLRGR